MTPTTFDETVARLAFETMRRFTAPEIPWEPCWSRSGQACLIRRARTVSACVVRAPDGSHTVEAWRYAGPGSAACSGIESEDLARSLGETLMEMLA
jgi:hypothetical protein